MTKELVALQERRRKMSMKLAFSTLGCPKWSVEEIIQRAVEYGYDGVELRGIQGNMSLCQVHEFTPAQRALTKEKFRKANLKVVCVSTSGLLNSTTPQDKEKNFLEMQSNLALAADLECPFIRVFSGHVPPNSTLEKCMDVAAMNLRDIIPEAEKYRVSVLVETHDALVRGKDLASVMNKVPHPLLGIIWDINHPFRAGETVTETFGYLEKYLRHVHIKDSVLLADGKLQLVLTGKGTLPIKEVVAVLRKHNYSGCLTLEWEKAWHPEIEEPAIAFPEYISVMKKLI
jgi:sugar phosphate isomerase/epimerase